jgi:hypothetical protein
MMDVDMTRMRRGTAVIDHGNDSQVVLIERSWSGLSPNKTEFSKDRPEVLGNFGSLTSPDELSFG